MKLSVLLSTLFLCLITSSLIQAQLVDSYPYPIKEITFQDSITVAFMDTEVGEEVLVLIHGLGSYGPAWTNNIDALSERFRVIIPDLPGYGLSSKNMHPVSLKQYSEVLTDLLIQLGIKKTSLVGHSMGGQIALTLALEKPEYVEKLVLVAPAGIESFNPQQSQILKSFVTPESVCKTTKEQTIANYQLNFYQMPGNAQFMIDDRLSMENQADFNQYCQSVSESVAAMLDEPVFQSLSEITQPTLIIFGKNDTLIPNRFLNPTLTTESIATLAEENIPNATAILIDNAGHFVQFERADPTNKAILKFLN